MIDEKQLFDQFPDHALLDEAIVKFWVETPKFKHFFYMLVGCASNRRCDLVLSSRDVDNDPFAKSVLLAAPQVLERTKLSIHRLEGNDYGFNEVLTVPPEFHSTLDGALSHREDLFLCVPAYKSEFSGSETKEEFTVLTRSVVPAQNWKRRVHPKLSLRFDNPKTQGGTIGGRYVFAKFDLLEREIDNLDGVTAGFIEIVNYQGSVVEIVPKSAGSFALIRERDDSTASQLARKELVEVVWEFLTQ